MEKINKTIKQALTTGSTENNNVKEFVIIPDLNAQYHMSLLLTSRALDLGFFNSCGDFDQIYYDNNNNNSAFIPFGLNNLY